MIKITRLLIANRGEIATRIIKTARRLGITAIAIYSECDANSPHVTQADEAYCVGPSSSRDSYLNQSVIIETAVRTKACAIHPGYGFLSENANFAEACLQANTLFVGPSVAAIKTMGDKVKAKTIAKQLGIPVTPDFTAAGQVDDQDFSNAAEHMGFPVLLKAVAGGGGRGMRRIQTPQTLIESLSDVRKEAAASFNDDRIFMEKYLTPARHIEVQILADQQGHIIHLFDRECSLQRRHQKLLEEAPAPNLSETLRLKLSDAAIQLARKVAYVGAGTVEFLVSDETQFYFMEMNTRLQVEHPITEMITGVDLVEWQLRIASGEALSLSQKTLQKRGHAIEVRLCAEDPAANFQPAVGQLQTIRLPTATTNLRIDSGVTSGQTITMYYDSLLAKLIAYDDTREKTYHRLLKALTETFIIGLPSNVSLLTHILRHPDFQASHINTEWLDTHQDILTKSSPPSDNVLACVAIFHYFRLLHRQCASQITPPISLSPWHTQLGWRLTEPVGTIFPLWWQKQIYVFHCQNQSDGKYNINWQEKKSLSLTIIKQTNNMIECQLSDQLITIYLFYANEQLYAFDGGDLLVFSLASPIKKAQLHQPIDNTITAPIPGTLADIYVNPKQQVNKGDRLLAIEAMKMLYTITAPDCGTVNSILFEKGANIQEGDALLILE